MNKNLTTIMKKSFSPLPPTAHPPLLVLYPLQKTLNLKFINGNNVGKCEKGHRIQNHDMFNIEKKKKKIFFKTRQIEMLTFKLP